MKQFGHSAQKFSCDIGVSREWIIMAFGFINTISRSYAIIFVSTRMPAAFIMESLQPYFLLYA